MGYSLWDVVWEGCSFSKNYNLVKVSQNSRGF